MSRLKGALIGYGAIAHNAHAAAFRGRDDFEISAVADSSPERLALAKSVFGQARTYRSLEDLLAAEEGLDFVDLATPPWLHGHQVLLALKKGLHVLCEKPLTLDRSEYRLIAEESRRSGRTVFTVHNWAYSPIWSKAAELIAAGELGDIHHAELHAVRTKPSVAASPGDWRTDVHLAGGGILVDHGWHNLYLLRRVLFPQGRMPSLSETNAFFHRPTPTSAEIEATVFFRFPAATALIHLTWRGASRSNWAVAHGSKATLELRDDHILLNSGPGLQRRFDFPDKLSAGSAHPEWFAATLPDFRSEIQETASRGRNLAEAGFVLDLLRQAYDGPGQPRPPRRVARPKEAAKP
ncbi:MAG TPA: hypothetical protein DEB40_09180 [Elusimicrobia bacterium]|nr:hypothetical protein [Elusimicrobiota bacterium]HBT61901.1 hypothetical protein [Elusimicrobiota bacterium]